MHPIPSFKKFWDMSMDFWSKITQNLHHNGVLPSSFMANQKLRGMFKILSTNSDRNGKPFVSSMEAYRYPFYATQWHPERNQFDWSVAEGLNKEPEALKAMQLIADFIVGEARKNFHSFPSLQDEREALIYNYPITYTADTDDYADEQTYYFPLASSIN
eukprot:TRINITY_DN4527_c0_g1_i5.p1 TRINITY_DN4527_c0_g1~~TRINITY_DN4527_c0_g1_i5.p1  ORF type:complete len:159 (+),score=31.11 TRINITY_DN4527_c0_g1_i5:281-757(+)